MRRTSTRADSPRRPAMPPLARLRAGQGAGSPACLVRGPGVQYVGSPARLPAPGRIVMPFPHSSIGLSPPRVMHLFRRARIPLACLPAPLSGPEGLPDPALEPWRECDILVDGNQVAAVRDARPPLGPETVGMGSTDLGGCLVFPGLLEVHTHLDKCHTWDRSPGVHSDFWESLHILAADSARWDAEDVYRRADFGLRTTWAHGTVAVRTHLDTSRRAGAGSHAALDRLRSEWRGRIEIQTVSLFPFSEFSGAGADLIVGLTARHGATAMGAFRSPTRSFPASSTTSWRRPASSASAWTSTSTRASWLTPNACARPPRPSFATSFPTPWPAATIVRSRNSFRSEPGNKRTPLRKRI